MISQLMALGQSLESQWDRQEFPQLAYDTLNAFEATSSLEEFESALAQWLMEIDELPKQLNLYNVFGEPPVTLFNNGKFAVDIYFWRKNDTLIHSHAFRGAFKVLYGKSLHEEFDVEVTEKIDDDIVFSNLHNSQTKIMNAGDTQIILPGMELVHRVVHLDNPTVTLCLRTVEDTELSQWHHLSTGLSYTKHNLKQLTVKQALYFQYYYYSDPMAAEEFLNSFISKFNSSALLSLYESIYFNEFGLDHEISNVILEKIVSLCEDKNWFQMYNAHYIGMNELLIEHRAPTSVLKLLAHAINCNYSVENSISLLGLGSADELKALCQELLVEGSTFSEEYYQIQCERIQQFAKL